MSQPIMDIVKCTLLFTGTLNPEGYSHKHRYLPGLTAVQRFFPSNICFHGKQKGFPRHLRGFPKQIRAASAAV